MEDYCSVPWVEDPTPDNLRSCTTCGLYQHGSRMIWGEGNSNAPIMVILDNPGAREDREGNPFVCGTRQTLQKAVHEVGLTEKQVYVTYILKRRPTKAYDKDKTRQICMYHLKEQLDEKRPKIILCLGNVVVQNFFNNKDVTVKELRCQIHMINGIPTIASYHPLAVRRRPNLWNLFIRDWHYLTDNLTCK